MRGQKALAMLMIIMLMLVILVQPMFVYGHEETSGDVGNSTSEDHSGSGKGGSQRGHYGKGGSGQDHSGSSDPSEEHSTPIESGESDSNEGEDGNSGKSEDKRGGIGSGGSGKGGSDSESKKGVPKKGSSGNGGMITLIVTVTGLPENLLPVDITLIRDNVPQTVSTITDSSGNTTATFLSEASGDCSLEGEPVPGYVTPTASIRLIGVEKTFEAALEYQSSAIPVTGISLNQATLEVIKSYSKQLTATVHPNNANSQEVTWESDNDQVATVTSNGFVEGVASGTATITAKVVDQGTIFTATCHVTVSSIESLVNPDPIDALKGQVVILPETITANLDNGTSIQLPVVWKTQSGEEVGSIFQLDANNPNIVYTLKGNVIGTDSLAILVINVYAGGPAVPVTGIALDEDALSLYAGQTYALTAGITPEDATTKDVVWFSSDKSEDVIKLDKSGFVTAVAPGLAYITVRALDTTTGIHEAYCQVSVSLAPEPAIIFPSDANGDTVEQFNTREDVYINVTNLVETLNIDKPTTYFVKVEEKSSTPLLGEGEIQISPNQKVFHLYEATHFEFSVSYSKEYFVSMSQDHRYPKDDEKTLKTNFKIGKAVPTVPKENISVNVDMVGGYRNDHPEGIVFLLCREIDKEIATITWKDYYNGAPPINPYPYNNNSNLNGVDLTQFTDEVKMMGKTNSEGAVEWIEPRETLKLGGYILLEVPPMGYMDNLNLVNPESDDGTLLKEVHLVRDGFIDRHVINTYIGGSPNVETPNLDNSTDGPTDEPSIDSSHSTDDSSTSSFDASSLNVAAVAASNLENEVEEIFIPENLAGHWAKKYVLDLANRGKLIKDYNDKIKNLDAYVTVEEFAQIVELTTEIQEASSSRYDLSDLKGLTRQQTVVLFMSMFGFEKLDNISLPFSDSHEIANDAKGYIAKANQLGIVSGYPDNTYRPHQLITRGEFLAILSKCLQVKEQI